MTAKSQKEQNPENCVCQRAIFLLWHFNTSQRQNDDDITMKFSTVLCLALPAVTAAFSSPAFVAKRTSALNVVTGPKGKPAGSKDQDLELTREVIASFMGPDEAAPAPAPPAEEEAPKKKKKKSKGED